MMWQLRWTLLVIGVVFIAVLAWWERRRPRQARGAPERAAHRETAHEGPTRLVRDPPLTLPEMRAREPLVPHELPVVESHPLTPTSHPAAAATTETEFTATDLNATDPDFDATRFSAEEAAAAAAAEEDAAEAVPALYAEADEAVSERQELTSALEAPPPVLESNPALEVVPPQLESVEDEFAAPPPLAITPRDAGASPASARRAAPTSRALPREQLPELPAGEPPVVNWPSDEERRILAVRLVAPMSERFGGRSLRQALAAEGFMLGQFAIFHKGDDERRAVLSAASLTRPGTFDMETMDSQHYGGLSLFAVLPGPKSPPQAFDELVFTARNLNERLHGVLQDEHGTPLTPARVAQLREQLRAAS